MMSRSKGFSLIELVVVLAIISTLMMLTGGLMQENIAKQERVVEIEKVRSIFKELTYKAFYNYGSIKVSLGENKLTFTVFNADNVAVKEEVAFNQLTFVANNYKVSKTGVVSPDEFSIIIGENIRKFPIQSLINEQKK